MKDPDWHHGDTEYEEVVFTMDDRREFFHLTRNLAASIRYLEATPNFIPDEDQMNTLGKLLDYLNADVQYYYRVSKDPVER